MDLETIYSLLNISVMPAWALLIFAPNWRGTEKIVHAVFIPLILACFYIYYLIWAIFLGGGAEGAGMSSLSQVMHMFDSPVSTLAGWAHYLVFDLFVGAWIVRDGMRRGISALWRAPCLIFTLMFGPVGLAMYLILRTLKGEGVSLQET